ncbi:MAG: T9SS C-terminal target domain-containing protein, partial [Bacteroidetes bacterium]
DVVASVFDLNGKLLQSQNYTAFDGFNEMNISTSGLQAGMYIVSLTNGGKHVSQKFVKFN